MRSVSRAASARSRYGSIESIWLTEKKWSPMCQESKPSCSVVCIVAIVSSRAEPPRPYYDPDLHADPPPRYRSATCGMTSLARNAGRLSVVRSK